MQLYSINNLKPMEVIDINTGSRLGYIRDLVVDCDEYKIISLIIPREKTSWFSKKNDIEIKWEDIVKIGTDVILVKIDENLLCDK